MYVMASGNSSESGSFSEAFTSSFVMPHFASRKSPLPPAVSPDCLQAETPAAKTTANISKTVLILFLRLNDFPWPP